MFERRPGMIPGALPGLLVVGRSGRALAASAVRAGYRCDVIDEFLDADTRDLARYTGLLPSALTVSGLQAALEDWQASRGNRERPAVIIPGSGFEADPGLLELLQQYGAVAGNAAAIVRQLKEPVQFFPLLDRLGIRHPPVSSAAVSDHKDWLSKPVGGEGGTGIRPWPVGQPPAAGCYLQQYCRGESISAVFIADGRRARAVGFNCCRTVGELNAGAADFRFAEIVRMQPSPALAEEAAACINALVRDTGLRGLCGMDMLLDADGMNVLEVNPRPPASFELHEAVDGPGNSLVAAHLAACAGTIPQRAIAADSPMTDCSGKRVVYCTEPVHIPENCSWPDWCRDRPAPGSRVEAGAPLCTILARGASSTDCRERLEERHEFMQSYIKNNLQPIEFNQLNVRKEVTA